MNVRLAYETYGDGAPVVVLHGLFGSARNWRTIADRLGEAYRVYAVDLRNHGNSPWTDDMDYGAMAADLAAFLDDRGLDGASLIGHSLGGKTAMTLALEAPERVERLVVVDIAPVPYQESLLSYVDAAADVQLQGVTRRAEVDEDLSGLIPDPWIRQFILMNLEPADGGLRWRLNLAALQRAATALTDFKPRRREPFTGPTLFVAGGRSDFIRRTYHPVLFGLFPNAELVEVADAGHEVHAEQPERFLQAVRGFLDRNRS
jgi:pimeloyl-ACP methyl ester carboxylesterase